MAERDDHRYNISIDGEWSLADFGEWPDLYGKIYAVFRHLDYLTQVLFHYRNPRELDRIFTIHDSQFHILLDSPTGRMSLQYPWRGGYSSVNFYRALLGNLRSEARPRVLEIRYASPGFIALGLVVPTAIVIKKLIKHVNLSIKDVNSTYSEVYKGMHERRMMDLDAKEKALNLSKAEIAFIVDSYKSLSSIVGLSDEQQKALTILAPELPRGEEGMLNLLDARLSLSHPQTSPLGSLKMLMSLTRRLKKLSGFEADGKTNF